MPASLLTLLFVHYCRADWSTWLGQGADLLAQDIGYSDFDQVKMQMRSGADGLAQKLGYDDVDSASTDIKNRVQKSFEVEEPHGKDPYSAGHGSVTPRGSDFQHDNPYSTLRGCALNVNEGKKMCWSTASVFDEQSWCWVDTECNSQEDCRIIFAWKPCYGPTFRKGTVKEQYNKKCFASLASKDGL